MPFNDLNQGQTNSYYTPHIEVIKRGKEWSVQFGIGNQFFDLYYQGTKAEANWMAKMLKKAFKNAVLKD